MRLYIISTLLHRIVSEDNFAIKRIARLRVTSINTLFTFNQQKADDHTSLLTIGNKVAVISFKYKFQLNFALFENKIFAYFCRLTDLPLIIFSRKCDRQ